MDIVQTGKVDAVLYDHLGQRIKSLYTGQLTRGKHKILLADKLDNLAAGVYLVKIHSVNHSVSVKLSIQ